jgi:hypothetical protein
VTEPLAYLLKKLEERRTDLMLHMVQGTLPDHAEYKRLCGVIQGLDHAAEDIKDLATKLEQQENE